MGSEDNIVFRLMLLGRSPKYELRSAFTPGHIRGYVYLECSMNKHLVDLLSKIPGIICTREGLKHQLIELADRPKLLTLPQNKRSVGIGQWVRILQGQYKGDVGLVCRTRTWGADVLLVPRLSSDLYDKPSQDTKDSEGKGKAKANDTYADTDTVKVDGNRDLEERKGDATEDESRDTGKREGQRKRKRNAAIRNTPKLFRPDELQNPAAARCSPSGHYFLGRLEFRKGLLFKWFNFTTLNGAVFEMPWSTSVQFAGALRDDDPVYLTRRPRPQEWIFAEGERVIVCSSEKRAVIQKIEHRYMEVQYNDEGTEAINWYDLQKDIEIGQFVTVLNGPLQGYEGWVLELHGDEATILNNVSDTSDTSPEKVSVSDSGSGLLLTCNRLSTYSATACALPMHLFIFHKRAMRTAYHSRRYIAIRGVARKSGLQN